MSGHDIHPASATLASFADGALRGRERAEVVRHVADCANCREAVWFAMPARATMQRRNGVPLASAAGVLLLLIAGWLMRARLHRGETPEPGHVWPPRQEMDPAARFVARYRLPEGGGLTVLRPAGSIVVQTQAGERWIDLGRKVF